MIKSFKSITQRNGILLILIILIYLSVSFIINTFVVSDDIFYNSFGNQIAEDRIKEFIENRKNWNAYVYLSIVLSVLLKIALTSVCLYTGAILFNIKIKYSQLFKISTQAELVFVFSNLLKMTLLLFFLDVDNIDDLNYSLFSIHSMFEPDTIEVYLNYPLQVFNLFELLYWIVLAILLGKEMQKTFWSSFDFVVSTYVVGLLIWLVFVSFLTLNFS